MLLILIPYVASRELNVALGEGEALAAAVGTPLRASGET
jgi:hypothetical protein